jgi:hypothetical protein
MTRIEKCERCPSRRFIVEERTLWRGRLEPTMHNDMHARSELFCTKFSATILHINCAECGCAHGVDDFPAYHWEGC